MSFDRAIVGENFKKRGFRFSYFDTAKDAVDYICDLIPEKRSIGFGGSVTVKETGLLDALQKDGSYTLYHRELVTDISAEELYGKMHTADWYVCSANALTEQGEIVNIDGRGNRVAALLNGPKNVVIVCGKNKLVSSVEEGISRTRNIASPLNARRLHRNTPCAVLNRCVDCNSPERMCNATVILHHPTSGTTVHVVVIDQDFGY